VSEQAVSKESLKELREKSGAGIVDCKKALQESNGDLSKAMDLLREKGLASAAKKSGRSASEGSVAIQTSADGKFAAMVEINCETDFVTKTDDFQELVSGVASTAVATRAADLEKLQKASIVNASSVSVEDFIKEKIGKIGENIVLRKYASMTAAAQSYLASYVHSNGKIGVLLEAESDKPEIYQKENFQNFMKDICMHIAATAPAYLDRTMVNPSELDKERAIYKKQVLEEGKPENIADKIVEGKLNKFYEDVCLLDQEFIKENKIKVSQVVDREAKALGGKIVLKQFTRIVLGQE